MDADTTLIDPADVVQYYEAKKAELSQYTHGNPFWDRYKDRIVEAPDVKAGFLTIFPGGRYIYPYEFDGRDTQLQSIHRIFSGKPEATREELAARFGIACVERFQMVSSFCFTVPSPDALDFIAHHSGGRILDPMCGTGYLTWLLAQQGVDCLSYDRLARPIQWGTVRRGHAPAATHKHGRDRTLLLSWPDYQSRIGFDTLAAYKGDTVIFVGEYSSCGDDALHAALDWGWYSHAGMTPVRWGGGLKDVIVVYKRRPRIHVPYLGPKLDIMRQAAYRHLLGYGASWSRTDNFEHIREILDTAPRLNIPTPAIRERTPVEPGPVVWLDEPKVDEYRTVTLGSWGGWHIQIMPMIFNDRVVLVPENNPLMIDYGWCFPKGGAAAQAAYAWNPATQAEPAGYIKAVLPGRKPGETAADGWT